MKATARKTDYGYRQWRKFAKTQADHFHPDFIKSQWELYWQGVRDVRLHDMTIWLIDRYGY